MKPRTRTITLVLLLAVVPLTIGVVSMRSEMRLEAEWTAFQRDESDKGTLAEECDRVFRIYDRACADFTAHRAVSRLGLLTGGIGGGLLVGIHLVAAVARRYPRHLGRAFQWAVGAAVAGGVLFIPLTSLLILVTAAWWWHPRTLGVLVSILLHKPVPCLVGTVFVTNGVPCLCLGRRAARLLVRRKIVSAVSVPADRKIHTRLWAMVGEVAHAVGSVLPDQILLGVAPSLYLTAASVAAPGGKHGGWTLYIPLPLCRLITVQELQALVAHELAHATSEGRDWTQTGAPLARGTAEARAEEGLHPGYGFADIVLLPTDWLLAYVECVYLQAGGGWARQREFAADLAAARVTSAGALAGALTAAYRLEDCWEARVCPAAQQALLREEPISNLSTLAADSVRAIARGAGKVSGDPSLSHPTDEHPSLCHRLAVFDGPTLAVPFAATDLCPDQSARELIEELETLETTLTKAEHVWMLSGDLDAVRVAMAAHKKEESVCRNGRPSLQEHIVTHAAISQAGSDNISSTPDDGRTPARGDRRSLARRLPRRLAIALGIVLLSASGVWVFGAYYVGMMAAKWDLAWGQYEVATYGYPQFPGPGAVQLDGGVVHLRLVAGCVVSTPTQQYVQGYNAVSIPAIAEEFGPESLQRLGLADTPEDEEPES